MKAPLEIGLLKRTQLLKFNRDVHPETHVIYPEDVEVFDGEDSSGSYLIEAPDQTYKLPELRWETDTKTKIRGAYFRIKNQIVISSLVHGGEVVLGETENGFDSFVLTGTFDFEEEKLWELLFQNWSEDIEGSDS